MKMKKLVRKTIYVCVSLVALFSMVLLASSLPVAGWRSFSVQTGSMEPDIKAGSLVFVHKTSPDDLKPGDVLTYVSRADKSQTVTHRLREVRVNEMGTREFIVKGDANRSPDEPVSDGQIVGKVLYHLPYLGSVSNFLRSPAGLVTLFYIPALVIILEEFKRLAAYYRTQRRYRVADWRPHHGLRGRRHFFGTKVVIGVVAIATVVASVPVYAALRPQVVLKSSTINSKTNTVPPSNTSVCNIHQNNEVSVTNESTQTASSSSATNSSNTNSGNATSGDVSNTNATSTSISALNSSTCAAAPSP